MAFLEFYKKGQGSLARLVGLLSLGGIVLWGAYALWVHLQGYAALTKALIRIPKLGLGIDLALVISLLVAVGGCIGVVWLMNRPKTVDLMVETESEMKKVSWPSRQEAWNSSVVVVITVLVMMALLFFYDVVLTFILKRVFYPEGA